MKFTIIAFCFSIAFIAKASPFVNLDFQSPNTAGIRNNSGLVKNIIPGWQLEAGGEPQQTMFYNTLCLSCPGAFLRGPINPRAGAEFVFTFKSGIPLLDPNREPASASVFLVGDVPADARSLLFDSNFSPTIDFLKVYLGGKKLDVQLFDFSGLSVYGADITGFAGKNTELRFTVLPPPFPQDAGGTLADIRFSAEALPVIPEPSIVSLLGLGLPVAFLLLKRTAL